MQQQRPQMGPIESEFPGSGEYRQTSNDPTNWDNQSSDPDLSEILDQVIEFVPDDAITSNYSNMLNYSNMIIFWLLNFTDTIYYNYISI